MEGYAWEACCEHWASIAQGGEIFLVYGHSSHEDFLANAKLADKGITIVTFDPNCTHVYQVGGVREAARSSCRNRVCAVGYMYVHYSMLGISLSCVMGLEGGEGAYAGSLRRASLPHITSLCRINLFPSSSPSIRTSSITGTQRHASSSKMLSLLQATPVRSRSLVPPRGRGTRCFHTTRRADRLRTGVSSKDSLRLD